MQLLLTLRSSPQGFGRIEGVSVSGGVGPVRVLGEGGSVCPCLPSVPSP